MATRSSEPGRPSGEPPLHMSCRREPEAAGGSAQPAAELGVRRMPSPEPRAGLDEQETGCRGPVRRPPAAGRVRLYVKDVSHDRAGLTAGAWPASSSSVPRRPGPQGAWASAARSRCSPSPQGGEEPVRGAVPQPLGKPSQSGRRPRCRPTAESSRQTRMGPSMPPLEQRPGCQAAAGSAADEGRRMVSGSATRSSSSRSPSNRASVSAASSTTAWDSIRCAVTCAKALAGGAGQRRAPQRGGPEPRPALDDRYGAALVCPEAAPARWRSQRGQVRVSSRSGMSGCRSCHRGLSAFAAGRRTDRAQGLRTPSAELGWGVHGAAGRLLSVSPEWVRAPGTSVWL